jgi:hypothetical protein
MNSKDVLFYVMIVMIVILSFYMIFWTHQEGFRCVSSPLTYGVSHLSSTNNGSITCSCSASGSSQTLIVNATSMSYSGYNSINVLNYTSP